MSAFILSTPHLSSFQSPCPALSRKTPSCSLSNSVTIQNASKLIATAALVAALTLNPHPIQAGPTFRLPPIDRSNPNRCQPTSSAIGQANAARDKLLDLRECDLRNFNLTSFDLSGAIVSNANLDGAKLLEAQLSKSLAQGASFRNADFTNAIADRVNFDGADLTNAIFANSVLSDSTFENANLENVDFTDAYIGDFAQRSICKNPTLKGTNPVTGAPTRESLGCR